MLRRLLLPLLLLGLVPLSACKGARAANSCEANVDCAAPGTRCNLETKQCVCSTDEACKEGDFCNSAGVCQTRAGCTQNSDCGAGTYCDVDSGKCLQGPALSLGSACGLADHCPYNTLCTAGTCQAGCFDDGDCVLGQVCSNGVCATGEGICSDDTFCDFKERCTQNQCKSDRRGPYCRGCSPPTMLNPTPCDEPRNFCLVNSLESGGFTEFCGVDCSLGQPCPNGYSCHGVLILTQDVCHNTAECRCAAGQIHVATSSCTVAAPCDPRNPDGTPNAAALGCNYPGQAQCNHGTEGGPNTCFVAKGQTNGSCTCTTNEECADGQACVAGLCCGGTVRNDRECVGGENRVSGFCSCATDDDCPRDNCDSGRGVCLLSGKPCTPGNDDCGAIPCADGACLIGQNCAPIQGLACSLVGGSGGM